MLDLGPVVLPSVLAHKMPDMVLKQPVTTVSSTPPIASKLTAPIMKKAASKQVMFNDKSEESNEVEIIHTLANWTRVL